MDHEYGCVSDSGSDNCETEMYLPNTMGTGTDELVCDRSAYTYFHEILTNSSILSFDLIPCHNSSLSYDDNKTVCLATGSQIGEDVTLTMISNIVPINNDEDDESDSELPITRHIAFQHKGGVNRIRYSSLANQNLLATWSDHCEVNIWKITSLMEKLESDTPLTNREVSGSLQLSTSCVFHSHKNEGFALDWSKSICGRLATGDNDGDIYVYSIESPTSPVHLKENASSIEDIQWSNNEDYILASCGSDGAVRIWDCRCNTTKSVTHVYASDFDVNVISWANSLPLIVSGDDIGEIKVWDLRILRPNNSSSAFFNYHNKPITSIEWHPSDKTTFVASSDDNQITFWDISAEKVDDDNEREPTVPPQLMFIHMGQHEIKEIHWHSQYTGLVASVDINGFNIFKPINM